MIQLTLDQENALKAFHQFYLNPNEQFFIIEGYAGVGKTTLVKHIIKYIDDLEALIDVKYEPVLTATTNKACASLEAASDMNVNTIYKLLDLYVQQDYASQQTFLKRKKGAEPVLDKLIFIDEASYVDNQLLKWVKALTTSCKVVFMGDPCQLLPVKCTKSPVFEMNVPKAVLTQVVRQEDLNPIKDVCELLRNTIKGDAFPKIALDNKHLIHVSREEFDNQIKTTFDKDWTPDKARVLAWTNKTVIDYNKMISLNLKGTEEIKEGDYVFNNHYIPNQKGFHADAVVRVYSKKNSSHHGVQGYAITANGYTNFMPKNLDDKKTLISKLRKENSFNTINEIESTWVDFRPPYASTINKAQGSTFDIVFIDLSDVSKCRANNQLARLLYVAISRARHTVIFTGDIA